MLHEPSSNANDVFNLQQSKTQIASSWLPGDGQLLDENGVLVTSGHGHIGQFADQHGTTQPNNCDTTGGGCVAETAIVNGVIMTPPRTAPSPAVEENPRRNTTNANDRLTTDSGALGRGAGAHPAAPAPRIATARRRGRRRCSIPSLG
jgi:hypothetical protein